MLVIGSAQFMVKVRKIFSALGLTTNCSRIHQCNCNVIKTNGILSSVKSMQLVQYSYILLKFMLIKKLLCHPTFSIYSILNNVNHIFENTKLITVNWMCTKSSWRKISGRWVILLWRHFHLDNESHTFSLISNGIN